MNYAEAAYFPDANGRYAHVQHIADYYDYLRVQRLKPKGWR